MTAHSSLISVIAKTWKQPKCPATDEWINKMYIHTVEYYSAIKSNEVLLHVTAWMNLENIRLPESSHSQKITCSIIPLYEMSRIGKSIERKSRLVVARAWDKGKWRVTQLLMGMGLFVMKKKI